VLQALTPCIDVVVEDVANEKKRDGDLQHYKRLGANTYMYVVVSKCSTNSK